MAQALPCVCQAQDPPVAETAQPATPRPNHRREHAPDGWDRASAWPALPPALSESLFEVFPSDYLPCFKRSTAALSPVLLEVPRLGMRYERDDMFAGIGQRQRADVHTRGSQYAGHVGQSAQLVFQEDGDLLDFHWRPSPIMEEDARERKSNPSPTLVGATCGRPEFLVSGYRALLGSRMPSSSSRGDILVQCFSQHLVSKRGMQLGGSTQVDLATQSRRQLPRHACDGQIANTYTGSEFHQHVHVTVRPEVVAQDRAEQSQPSDPVLTAEPRNAIVWNVDGGLHSPSISLQAGAASRQVAPNDRPLFDGNWPKVYAGLLHFLHY